MSRLHGHIKVYFFAMVMSRSRQKFVYFSLSPFTTALAIYAHEMAFKFYGGSPDKILYDQDKVLLHAENLGDLILTHCFRQFVNEIGFEAVFCRKSDPESKGKIENVVKYIKYNFLRGRTFTDIDSLNKEVNEWLERTANGNLHATTKLVPAEVFKEEQHYLKPYMGTPTPPKVEMKAYYVRKDNTINYKGNYYSLPTGTYHGHNTLVYIHVYDTQVHLFDKETGKTLAIHTLSLEKGKLVRNSSHSRDTTSSLQALEDKVKNSLGASTVVDEYLEKLQRDNSRYYRDNLSLIERHLQSFSTQTMQKSFSFCLENGVYNAAVLIDVAKSLQKQNGETPPEMIVTSLDNKININEMIPQKTDITFQKHFSMKQKELLKSYASRLRLYYLATHLEEMVHKAQEDKPSYLEFIVQILESEIINRDTRDYERRLSAAHLPSRHDLDLFDFNFSYGVTPSRMKELRELLWMEQAYNVILMGPSGTGKTYIKAYMLTMGEIITTIKMKEISPTAMSAYNRIVLADLIAIDDIMLFPVKKEDANGFFNLINTLHEKTSIIITTNKAPAEWPQTLDDEVLVTALLNRVLYRCEVIKLTGTSYRMENRKSIFKEEL